MTKADLQELNKVETPTNWNSGTTFFDRVKLQKAKPQTDMYVSALEQEKTFSPKQKRVP